MTVHEPSAVVLRAHRTDLAQPPSSVLEVVTLPPQEPAAGQVRVQNLFQQVIAASGDLMFETSQIPVPVFRVGEPIYGPAIGRVVESRAGDLPVGTVVLHMSGPATASPPSSTPSAPPSSRQRSGTRRPVPASRCAAPSPDRSAAATAGTPASTS
jgi:NADPH-dependent curcumin reductase CurA